MGQQQLILLVLAVIIVSTAIVIGIRAFREHSVRSNADVLIQDVMTIALDAVAWKQAPSQFDGQDEGACKSDPSCFNGINFKKLGYGVKGNPFRYENLNGEFRIVERKDAFGLMACNEKMGNKVIIEFRGVDPDSIVLVEQVLGTDADCKK